MKRVLNFALCAYSFLAISCGEKVENHLTLGVSAADNKVLIMSGMSQPCSSPESLGGLPDVSGYYFRVENSGFYWTSTTSTFIPQSLSMYVTLPGGIGHECTFRGEELAILFGLPSLSVGPASTTDTCGEGDSSRTSCIEYTTRDDGNCSAVCGGLPLSDEFPNFIVPATLELSGLTVSGDESSRVSASTKVLVEFSK